MKKIDIQIDNQIDINKESNIPTNILVSGVDIYKFNLDVIFINDKFKIKNKEYYKLFIRPALQEQYFINFFNQTKEQKANIKFKQGAIKFYIKTENGNIPLKTNKDETLNIPFYEITQTESKSHSSKNFDFIGIDIPSELIENNNITTIIYSARYNVEGWNLIDHNVVGSITIKNQNIIEYRKLSDTKYNIKIQNKIFAYLQNQKQSEYLLAGQSLDIEFKSFENRLDNDLQIKYDYFKWNNNFNINYLGLNFLSFLKLYVDGIATTYSISSEIDIFSNNNINKYYDLKKIEDDIKIEGNQIYFKLNSKTNFNNKQKVVIDNDNGKDGIIYNPIYSDSIIFSRKVIFNNLIIHFNQMNEKNDFFYSLEYDIFKLYNYFQLDLKYELHKINEINIDNKQEIIDYLNENK